MSAAHGAGLTHPTLRRQWRVAPKLPFKHTPTRFATAGRRRPHSHFPRGNRPHQSATTRASVAASGVNGVFMSVHDAGSMGGSRSCSGISASRPRFSCRISAGTSTAITASVRDISSNAKATIRNGCIAAGTRRPLQRNFPGERAFETESLEQAIAPYRALLGLYGLVRRSSQEVEEKVQWTVDGLQGERPVARNRRRPEPSN